MTITPGTAAKTIMNDAMPHEPTTTDARDDARAGSPRYATDDERYRAIVERDARADGAFLTAVATTRIYCRPTCSARTPKRENVSFYRTADAAEAAGYRACKRCRPRDTDRDAELRAAIARACALVDASDDVPSLERLAAAAGLSPHHFHRAFTRTLGITPRRFASARRAERLGSSVRDAARVTDAAYEAGYGSSSGFYDESRRALGMTPAAFRERGAGERIRIATATTSLGTVVVAATERGVCAVRFGDDATALHDEVRREFARATFVEPDAEFAAWTRSVVAGIEGRIPGDAVPLDLHGTLFQRRVWDALTAIPRGERVSYADVARRVGTPAAVRAVASAIGANPAAVAVPCHRVVGSDGALRGYRWGIERKRALLERERAAEREPEVARGSSAGVE